MRLHALLPILGVALLGFAPAPFQKPDRRRADPNDLTGVWELTVSEVRGVPEADQNNYLCEITRDQLAFVNKTTRRRTAVYSLRLFPDLAPAAFTWMTNNARNNAIVFVGSYRLRGNELTLVFSSSSRLEMRPTDFEGKPEYRYRFRRLHR
jgi:uncharacterized protein (TIGR03067 family)